MINIAIINTQLGGTDIPYGTTPISSADMNDTFNKVYTYVGSDMIEGSIASSTDETELSQVVVTAGTLTSEFIVFVSFRFRNITTETGTKTGTVRIRTGTSATATSNTEREVQVLGINNTSGGNPVSTATIGGMVMVRVVSPDEDFSTKTYIHITGQNSFSNAGCVTYIENVLVLGR